MTIGIWVLVIVISLILRVALFEDAITTVFAFTSNPDSKRADGLIEDRFLIGPKGTKEVVIVQSQTLTVDDPAYQEVVEGVFEKLVALGPDVIRKETLVNYYQEQARFLVSEDRHTTIMPFTMAGEFDDASENIGEVIDIAEQSRNEAGFRVLVTGQATVGQDFEKLGQAGGHHRPNGARARQHEAVRQMELVLPTVAQLAPGPSGRNLAGAGPSRISVCVAGRQFQANLKEPL